MSYVSTSSVVFLPSAATCEANAVGSSSCSSVNACAAVPAVGMPYRSPAARLEVYANPARYADRAAATAASSWVRREPISMTGAAAGGGDHAGGGRGDRAVVVEHRQHQRLQHHALGERAGDVRIGEPGKNSSPSAYPSMSPVNR